MTLNELQLDTFLLAKLYNRPIIPEKTISPEIKISLKHLGKNRRNILVIIQNPDEVFLDESSLQLLNNIMQACQVNIHEDIALFNIAHFPGISWKELQAYFEPKVVLYFGVSTTSVQPVKMPSYQVVNFQSTACLSADPLLTLDKNKSFKQLLWKSLQQLFHLQ
jgi:hypothetical protein